MTQEKRAVSVALLALASGAETFGLTLREIVKRELAGEGEAEPCKPPEFVDPALPPPVTGEYQGVQYQMQADYGTASRPTPPPDGGPPVIEFHDTGSNDLWLIDEVGNVTINGILAYVAPVDDPATSFARIGSRLWFKTARRRWFAFDGNKPVLQPDPPTGA